MALLSVIVVLYTFASDWLRARRAWRRELLAGGLFGIGAVLVMAIPIHVGMGVFFDMRGVVVGLAGPFGGIGSTIIAAAIAATFRYALGGVGMVPGFVGIALAALVGVCSTIYFRHYRRSIEIRDLLPLGILLTLQALAPIPLLPAGAIYENALSIAWMLGVAIPIATVILGGLMIYERNRRQLADALAGSESRLKTLTENMPALVFQRRMSPDGKISYAYLNGRVLEIYGVTPEEAIANPNAILDAIHPEDIGRFRSTLETSRDTLTYWELEFRILGPGRSIKWLKGRGIPRRMPNGDTIWDSAVVDITAAKAADQSLRESEARYRLLADNATDMIARVSIGGIRRYISPACGKILGYRPEELIGRPVSEIVHPDDIATVRKAMHAIVENGGTQGFDVRVTRRDGAVIWLESRMNAVIDSETGNVSEIVTVLREVSKRVALEKRLEESARLIRGILENMTQGLCVFDRDLRLVLCNKHYLAMLDYPEELGRPGTKMEDILRFRFDRGDYGEQSLESVIADRRSFHRPGHSSVTELRGPNGTVIRTDLNTDDDGLMVGTLTDITQLKRHEAAIEESRAKLAGLVEDLAAAKQHAEAASVAKSQFLANMSHELRTPLNAVIGFSELIRDMMFGPIGDQQYVEYATIIHDSGEHLLELINDILDFSKIDAGRLSLHEELIEPGTVIEQCARIMLARAAHGNVTLTCDIAPDLPYLRADEKRVRQILLNLLSNAIKYTPAGGRVAAAARIGADGAMELAVSDTGSGIADEDQARVMEAFVQVENENNRKNEGTGLGLPLTKRLVELHGGSLELDSAPGKGTTVTARFPRERVRALHEIKTASA